MMSQELPELLASSLGAPFSPAPERICHSHWMGHLPFAFWLMERLRPSLFVELGTYQGASFCAFCQEIARLGLDCEAYAIDTWHGDANMGTYGSEVHADLAAYIREHYQGFACLIRSPFDQAVSQFEDGSIDLLHIDGYHSREAILSDFETWLPKMSPAGVILMHDIRARLPGYGGVAAWQEISSRFPTFAFNHGYGLGVVLTGTRPPEAVRVLCELDNEQAASFRSRFQKQAALYDALFRLEETRLQEVDSAKSREENLSRKFAEEFAAEKSRSDQENARLGEEKAKMDAEYAKLGTENAQLREALLHAELKAQAYEGSISWKLTAPLRKISRFFRS